MINKNTDYLKGYQDAIKDLRDLQKRLWHEKIWSHSRDLKFAPVELSDYLVIRYNKKLKECIYD